MPDTARAPHLETDRLLEKMPAEEREYLLRRLATEKLASVQSPGPIPVLSADDGTVVGYLRKVVAPSKEEIALVHERARRMDSSPGRSARELLDRMRAGDVEAVEKFIQ